MWTQWRPRSQAENAILLVPQSCSGSQCVRQSRLSMSPQTQARFHSQSPQSQVIAPVPSSVPSETPSRDLASAENLIPGSSPCLSSSHAARLTSSPVMAVLYPQPLGAKGILGKKNKAKSIIWLQTMLARWGQEDGEFKPSLGSMRHGLNNRNKNAPKQNLNIIYYTFITML